MVPEIKFCGFTRPEDVACARDCGVDYVGLVLAPSRRQVTLEQGRQIVSALGGTVPVVGVFVSPTVDQLLHATGVLGLAAAQVHGALTRASADAVRRHYPTLRFWTVRSVGVRGVEPAAGEVSGELILLDTYSPTASGGTGRTFDWRAAQAAVATFREREGAPRVGVAGGLDPDNVQVAIETLGPDLVDVSSGIECAPGRKDHGRMREFVTAVRGRGPA